MGRDVKHLFLHIPIVVNYWEYIWFFHRFMHKNEWRSKWYFFYNTYCYFNMGILWNYWEKIRYRSLYITEKNKRIAINCNVYNCYNVCIFYVYNTGSGRHTVSSCCNWISNCGWNYYFNNGANSDLFYECQAKVL